MADSDMILSPLVDFVISTLDSKPIEKGLVIYQVGDDIDALSDKLSRIRNLLADAEARQITERSVRRWLGKLKDVAYDADDVLDDIAYEALRQKAEDESNQRKRKFGVSFSSSPFSFDSRQEMANRIKEINERMEKIDKAKEILSLREGDHGRRASEQIDQRRLTTSLLTVSKNEIYGREKDKEEIINMLLSEDDGTQASLISIVGMGGLGKTTLSQLVYNDPNVKNYFQIRAWVCVSEDFDISRLTKEIIESATRKRCYSSSLDPLQRELEEILSGKSFLIVLDDVWNDNPGAWEILRVPFRVGAKGSKIIVTTRNDAVSTAMNTHHPFRLKVLGDEDCLSLFLQHAFPREYPDAINPELREIGEELVKRRCQGLPLAAKVLGGLLSYKRDLNSWESILKSQQWSSMEDESEIMKPLRVSYHHLPLLHIKQCFAFCSIFPKDHPFDKESLVHSWMAHGFIQPREGTNLEEEIGSEYFDFLLSRSFFQVETGQWLYDRIYYKMHDCIRDLAISVSSDECFRIEHGKPTPSPIKGHRHSSFTPDENTKPEDFRHLYRCKGLRTFILNLYWKIGLDMNEVIRDLNRNLRCLRVLVLDGFDLIELPDSISNLKHLRYLDLSNTNIRQLPESVSSLYNLQTLNLAHCTILCQLPKETKKLVNLRHLNLDDCDSLKSMPSEMGRLTCLQMLPIFIVGKEKGCGIGELKGLTALKGALWIKKLNNVSNAKEAEEANLKGKPNIEQLDLWWDIDNSNEDDEARTNMQQVLEALQPPKNIKTLSIRGYGGKNFSTWLQDEKLPNLEDLNMWGLRNCSSEEEGAFPSLQRLEISKCPKLTKMPNNFSALKHLEVVACDQLECLPKCPSLVELELWYNNENLLRWVTHLTSLSTLTICGFRELESMPGDMLQPLVNLEELRIGCCDKLVSFLEENNELPPVLRSLCIWDCPNIKSMPKGLRSLTSLKDLDIKKCPQLVSFLEEGLPTSLQSLKISDCPKLSERCRKGDGEDWAKISHIPRISIDKKTIS